MKEVLKKYIAKFSKARRYNIRTMEKFDCAVVIPACSESKELPFTVESLKANDFFKKNKTAVVIVVNMQSKPQTGGAPPAFSQEEIFRDNTRTVEYLEREASKNFNIFILENLDGEKIQMIETGVGEARRIGMDASISVLDPEAHPFIASLDADTIVEKNYLEALFSYFNKNDCSGAVIRYSHRAGETREADDAITNYELYLRNYVEGLHCAGSPYAFHSIGSAMAFPLSSYLKIGGMKIRKGGEDFYFLQDLKKNGRIDFIAETAVHPSPRLSTRTPFGTGVSLRKIINGEKKLCYNSAIFSELKDLTARAEELFNGRNISPEEWIKSLNPPANAFFNSLTFNEIWNKIIKNVPSAADKRRHAFYSWFDAFRTLKFIHFCENEFNHAKFAKKNVLDAWKDLWKLSGRRNFDFKSGHELLDFLREEEKRKFDSDYDSGSGKYSWKNGVR
jgi:hypothetical protein